MTTTRTAGVLTGIALFTAAAASPAAAQTDDEPPTLESLSEETYGGLSLGEGAAGYPVDQEFTVMLLAEEIDVPESAALWLLPPEGEDPLLVGEGPVELDTYENPGSPTYEPEEVGLIEATISSEELPYSGMYGLAATDPSGELITWSHGTVALEGDDAGPGAPGFSEDDGTPDPDLWPIPGAGGEQDESPGGEPPTLASLGEERYGVFALQAEDPVLPLDEPFTVEAAEGQPADVEFWLLPPDGGEAISVDSSSLSEDDSAPDAWELQVSSADVEDRGIYGLVGTTGHGVVEGWTPFAVSPGGESIEPGDPGVNAEDTNADRSIWPIPDSVPVPEQDTGEADDGAGAGSPEEGPAEGTEDAAAQGSEDGDAEAADTGSLAFTGTTVAVLAGVAVVLLGLGTWLVLRGRNRPDST